MKTRKQKELEKVNILAESRYLYNKFLKEDTDEIKPKLTVSPVENKGPVKKWKVSLFVDKNGKGLKDIMTPEMIDELGLKYEYADQESAQIDINKTNLDKIKL